MVALKLALLVCLIGAVAAQQQQCKREDGDTLLDTIPFLNIIVAGPPRLNKNYPGYKITCVKCQSLLNGVGEILGLSVLDGGFGCNFVLAQINLTNLLGSCKVYGVKGQANDCNDSRRRK
ncbi:uncharacterized protein LOC111694632 [Trichogramma pretiosum]|uniref:uncharacterized protein LOC111694632 n=1 Tax=Trichogramma pretiosum TaxID=7493 RepID=UPI000C71AEE5|nr:uncharacterized protein LOC111694632 [Trichogramma pretiosum]